MCDATIKAFELAHKWRTPVYVLADGVLGQMIEPLRFPEKAFQPVVDNSWAVAGTPETRKNLVTSIFLDFDQLEAFNNRLQEKYAAIEEAEVLFEEQQTSDADIVLVAYGISARICESAVEKARALGLKVGLFRPKTLFPFPKKQLQALAARPGVTFISVEMSNGQLADDIRLAIGCSRPVELVNRLGGNLLTLDQVKEKILAVAGK
jgi:2-oxoisovalerate ferredoxin oxidoreductase alpha subunit